MASLQTYLDAAKSAILAGAYDRAVSICLHVIDSYPKHIDAHCLLAEAYREKGQLVQAEDVFLRVLSADPENLVARWALSVIAEERGEAEAALCQIRRAFDVNPRHSELRKELLRLSGARPQFSSAALGRLYMQQGLTEPAIREFRTGLAKESDRLDVRVALAEALFSVGRLEEAAALCHDILADSPDCLKANVILGGIYLERDGASASTGRELLARAEALDPENVVASQLLSAMGMASSPKPRCVQLPPMDREEEILALDLMSNEVPQAPLVEISGDEAGSTPDHPVVTKAEPVAVWSDTTLREGSVSGRLEPQLGVAAGSANSQVSAEAGTVGAPRGGDQDSPKSQEGPMWLDAFAPSSDMPNSNMVPAEGYPVSGQSEVEVGQPQSVADFGEEWASLLTEEISLDAESEARLEAALADARAAGTLELEDGWLQTSSPISSIGSSDESTNADGEVESNGDRRDSDGGQEVEEDSGSAANPCAGSDLLTVAIRQQEAGQVDLAVEGYRELLMTAPELAESICHQLKLVLANQPDHGRAHRVLGDAYMKLGRFQMAIEEYNWVLSKGKEEK